MSANAQVARPDKGTKMEQMGTRRTACRRDTSAFFAGSRIDNIRYPACAYEPRTTYESELKCGNCQLKSSIKSAKGASGLSMNDGSKAGKSDDIKLGRNRWTG